MQLVCDVQIKYKHATLIKLRENPLKNHSTLKNVMFALNELTITNHKKPSSVFQGDVPTEIASIYLSKYPNGDQSIKYIDIFNCGD